VRGLPFEGRLVVRPPRANQPWWVRWLATSIPEIGQLLNASNAAVLVLRTSGRLFAVTFGYGRGLMVLDAFERDFGLRVALNVVDPDSLVSVDAKTFEQLTLMTRSQTSRAAPFETFRVNKVEDIMKAVTGTPRDPAAFGSRITGADAAKITYVPVIEQLNQKCDELLTAYRSEVYKERFGFIDDLRIVRDRPHINELNQFLLQRLSAGDLNVIHMAPPEVTDVQDIEWFEFDQFPGERSLSINIELYCDRMQEEGLELSVERLRKGAVGVTYRGSDEVHPIWTVYDCIVAEIPHGDKLFILSGGTWYQVEATFVQRVSQAAERWAREPDFLPAALIGESEPAYNVRAAEENGLRLFDEMLARPAGAHSGIEFCDLLAENNRMIHVKRRSRSSTLSHLFAQAIVSAETFLRDSTYRADLCTKLHERGRDADIDLIPGGRPTSTEWEVVYAILGVEAGDTAASLPFFSQLNFKIAAERLDSLGFQVSLRLVPLAAA
jgi:uncharacterized protein (TIGR04141 family)